MTPYRFAFLRIAFGIYLIGFFYMMLQLSILPEASYVYWGLMGLSGLFLLGYRRQLLSRSLVFFSYLLFAFEQPHLNFNSVLMILVLLFFAVVEGNEPWRIKTIDNNNADTRFDVNPARLKIYSISQVVLFGVALTATYAFNIFTRPNFNSWSIWTILVIFCAIIFPQFLVRAKKQIPAPILFFDGVCGLCNHFVDFVFAEDTKKIFQVAALQGKTAAEKLPKELRENLNTVVIVSHDGKIYQKSEAVLNLLYDIGGFWRLFFVFRILPRPLCDLVYIIIAKFRYNIFGKTATCRLPTPAERALFLS